MSSEQSGNAVIVVDDDVHVRAALGIHLETMGFAPVIVPDGPTALRILHERSFLVAIVDLHMPGMSGLEVARAIREYDATIQCIVLTGHASLESAVQALREQVYDYLAKPVSMTDLARVVGRAAEHARLLRHKRDTDAELAARSQELSASLEALREAQGRLIRTENAALMGQLAEGLRHELGNALTIIRLNMNLLAYYREEPDRFARHMASLGQGVQAIERIAFALRFFPTTEGEDGEALDLAAVIRQSASEALQAHAAKSATVHFDLDEPAPVRGSIFQLIRAFVGIVENAIEASAEQDAPSLITITMKRASDRWLVAVRDNGRGFTPEALEHALEPGFTTKIERGFVRGLFVASHVIDRHGGELRLSNLPEGGALVQTWLPCADA
jgi:C4-dicarboxylate-specific signal transduction histidine kinase